MLVHQRVIHFMEVGNPKKHPEKHPTMPIFGRRDHIIILYIPKYPQHLPEVYPQHIHKTYNVGPPSDVSWFINPMNTIVICVP